MGENRVHPRAAEQPVSALLGADFATNRSQAATALYMAGYEDLGAFVDGIPDSMASATSALAVADLRIEALKSDVRRLSAALVYASVRVGEPGEITNASQRGQALADVRRACNAALDFAPADGPLEGQDGQLRDEHSTVLPTPPSEGGAET